MNRVMKSTLKILAGVCVAWLSASVSFAGVGISGTGRTAYGGITAFGSVFVNGIQYSTSSANIVIGGIENRPESELKLGMAVRVEGTINPDGKTGVATRIEYGGDIEGTIDAAPVVSGGRGSFTVYGFKVTTDAKTIYENVSGLSALAAGDAVEVSGFFNANDASFVANRIEKRPAFRKAEVRGNISNVTATTFVVGPSLVVNYSTAEFRDVPPSGFANGMFVEVKATTPPASNTLQATRVSVESSDLASTNVPFALLQGVTAKVTASGFEMGNLPIVTDAQTVYVGATPATFRAGAKAIASGPVANGVMTAEMIRLAGPSASNDLSGDGNSDILVQSADGALFGYLMNGISASGGSGPLLGASAGRLLTNTADFNGDGKTDLLVQDPNGTAIVFLVDGLGIVGGNPVVGGNGWSVSHTADLNGDGKTDLVLKHVGGSVYVLIMDGMIATSGNFVLGTSTGWSVSHTADFNGDGKTDLILKHTNGAAFVYLMDGGAVVGGNAILGANTGWSVTHAGDLNGDGNADLVLRHTDGSVYAYLMNGATVTGGGFVLGPGTNWRPALMGDLSGDGKADLVLQNSNGGAFVYLMNGLSVASGGWVQLPTSPYRVTHLQDFNGDGKADIVLRHAGANDGSTVIFLMDGVNVLAGALLFGANTGLSVVPAQLPQ